MVRDLLHRTRLACLVLCLVPGLRGTTLAQEPERPGPRLTEYDVAAEPDTDAPGPASADLKSESTALTLSLASTLAPLALGIALIAADGDDYDSGSTGEIGAVLAGSALYFGPAVGYWYGGAAGRGWKGVGIRFAVGAATTLGALAICGGDRCSIWGDDDGATAGAGLLLLAGGGFILGSAIYDIAKVKSHVRKANEEKLQRSGVELSLAPTLSPAGGGTVGIVGRIRF